jgi:hypothetical protein
MAEFKVVDDLYAVIVLGYPQPLEPQFAAAWPIGDFVYKGECDHEHWGPCNDHLETASHPAHARFYTEEGAAEMMKQLAQIKHVTFEVVLYRRHHARD